MSSAVFLLLDSPPPSYLRTASQVIARPSAQARPVLETCLWLPTACRILSNLPEIAQLSNPRPSPGDSVPQAPHPSRLPHLAATLCASTRVFPASAHPPPLHTLTPACCPGQILGLTCPGSPRALLQTELASPRGSPVPCAGLFGESESPVCLLSSKAGLHIPRERPGQTDNRYNPQGRSPSVSPGPLSLFGLLSLLSVYTLVPNP